MNHCKLLWVTMAEIKSESDTKLTQNEAIAFA